MKKHFYTFIVLIVFIQCYSQIPAQSDSDNAVKNKIESDLKKLYFDKYAEQHTDIEDYVKIWSNPQIPAFFAGDASAWRQYIHCCVDQSVLAKDNMQGKRFYVKVNFVIAADGQPFRLEVADVPKDCPDCAIEALKFFYKHVVHGSNGNKCNVITTKEPYKQWVPAISVGRKVNSYVTVFVPFGYEDEPLNNQFVHEHYVNNPEQDTESKNNDDSQEQTDESHSETETDSPKLSPQSDAFTYSYDKASVIKKDNKYMLTLLSDKSSHTVFRPLPKQSDTAMFNKYNRSITLNQGGWAEVTTDKNGMQIIKFYAFTDGTSVIINSMTYSDFEQAFYNPD